MGIMTKKFNWGIWARKVGLTSLAILLAGGASVYADNPYWLTIVPILHGLQNYIKHK